jgi:Flp pilus assembly protein TadD
MATDYLSKGLFDRASAEINRSMARGNPRADGLALLGEVFAKQGLFGEALERFRDALQLEPGLRTAAIGEAWSLVRLGRSVEARPIAETLSKQYPDDVDLLMLVATACADSGDPAAALSALETARRVAPMRAGIHQRIGDIADSL